MATEDGSMTEANSEDPTARTLLGPFRGPAAGQALIRRRRTTVTLADGTRILIRPVVPEDKERFVEGFRRLSVESRYRRFMTPIEELTPQTLKRLTEIDYVDHFASGEPA